MNILTARTSAELSVKNSRFIAELIPVATQPLARSVLREQKQRYADATHVVHACIVGAAAEIMGMSDDGEPPGTAGRPVLDILKGAGCTGVLLTVTRYFGGTLLGTGGLVKAYGDAARAVIQQAADSGLFEPLVEKSGFSFSVGYDKYDAVKRLFTSFHVSDCTEVFDTDVLITGAVRADEYSDFAAKLRDLSNGKIVPVRAPCSTEI